MNPSLDNLCRSRCICRTREGCRLNQHPMLARAEFFHSLIMKTVINGNTVEEIKAPLLDILDEMVAFEERLPETCAAVWAEFCAALPPSEGGVDALQQFVAKARKEKGLSP